MAASEFETRLARLESEVANLKEQLPARPTSKPWWEKNLGTFENDPAYDEAMQLGQQYRQSFQNTDESALDS